MRRKLNEDVLDLDAYTFFLYNNHVGTAVDLMRTSTQAQRSIGLMVGAACRTGSQSDRWRRCSICTRYNEYQGHWMVPAQLCARGFGVLRSSVIM